MLAELNQSITDYFIVVDEDDNPVTGLLPGDFSFNLYDPTGAQRSSSIGVIFTETGNGHYMVSFTPDIEGTWTLTVYHATYFPAGKTETYQVYNGSINDLNELKEMTGGRWKIENNQMVFYGMDNNTEIARFDLLDESGNPAMENVFERVKV